MTMAATLSYICTPLEEKHMYQTLPDRLRHLAEQDPNRDAFIFYDKNMQKSVLSRAEICNKSLCLAKLLAQMGVKKGSPVAICMNSSMNMLVTIYSVVCAGGEPFFVGASLKDGTDLIDVLTRNKCELFIIDCEPGDDNWTILDNIWPQSSQKCPSVQTLQKIIYNGNSTNTDCPETRISLEQVISMKELCDVSLPVLYPEDEIGTFCTSGSTGHPKDTIYTHFSILNWTKQTNIAMGIKGTSVYFCDRSFGWAVGYPRTYLVDGATRVFLDPSLTTGGKHIIDACNVIEKERCDVAILPGYIVTDLLKHPELAVKFKSVDTAICTGERVPEANFALKGQFCRRVATYYGSTEVGGITSYWSDDIDDYESGIIGKPLCGAEMKIADPTGAAVPIGEVGEIYLRAPWRFAGYKHMEDMFRACVDNTNWFHSGDMGRMREDRNTVMEGRKQEMISIQTSKYFPWNIEAVLQQMPGAKYAFAVGVPCERNHEVVCACIVPDDDATITVDDIKAFCDEKFLDSATGFGSTKKPAYHLVLETLPLTFRGKIDRRGIKMHAAKQLKL